MNSQKYPVYLALHGHFYQPPRENPWIDEIEFQESAYPDHDWNERIAKQCYIPNCVSRMLDSSGKILNILNNYEYMNFDFGPTLLSWLQKKYPIYYNLVVQADKSSMERNGGHGNAIAQAYNHIILPLADKRDKFTQIRWGKADFRLRFGREPESMWLPETAINMETVECLIQEGIKFVILAPTQALRIRPINSSDEKWIDVSRTNIHTNQAYRIFPKDAEGKATMDGYLDAFFYDPFMAHELSFGGLTNSADALAQKILDNHAQYSQNGDESSIVNIATDGETYGHHKPFADMCLATLFGSLCEKMNIQPISYGYYLEKFPPKMEVELKNAHSEGTSWSCVHGAGRWIRDCGCSTGGKAGWNQKWRTPLRNAFDRLKQAADIIFEIEGKSLFEDRWAARDEYISVILNRNTADDFLRRHLKSKKFSDEEKSKAFQLLEAQRKYLLSFTSCGWFFADISGIEPKQNMIYASQSLELLKAFNDKDIEEELLSELELAKSNIRDWNGKRIYLNTVKNASFGFDKAASLFVFNIMLLGKKPELPIYTYDIVPHEITQHDMSDGNVFYCRMTVEHVHTLVKKHLIAAGFLDNTGKAYCFVSENTSKNLADEIARLGKEKTKGALGCLRDIFHLPPTRLSNMVYDYRETLAKMIFKDRFHLIGETYKAFYDENYPRLRIISQCYQKIPPAFRVPVEHTLSSALCVSAKKFIESPGEEELKSLMKISFNTKGLRLQLDTTEVSELLARKLINLMEELEKNVTIDQCRKIHMLMRFADEFPIKIGKSEIENRMFSILKNFVEKRLNRISGRIKHDEDIKFVVQILYFAQRLNFNIERFKEKIKDADIIIAESVQRWA